MSIQTISPVKQALVKKLRTSSALVAELTGGIHEGVALTGKEPPYLTYQVAYAPRVWDSTNTYVVVGFDILVTSTDQVQAQNLDQLVVDVLEDASLDVGGQFILLCRRVMDLSSADIDEAGHKFYQVGGTFEVWSGQVR